MLTILLGNDIIILLRMNFIRGVLIMTVSDLNIGNKGIVKNIYGNEKLKKRLLALGCVAGTEIEIKRIAPLGDPILVRFRGFDLAIRKKDAKNMILE